MKTVVTGGAGFLGSNLCAALIARGDDVLCIDDFSTGNVRNIVGLKHHQRFAVMRHDITVPFTLPDVDQVYHFACPASPIQYQRNPVKTIKTNVYGSIHVLEAALDHAARILQASTSEVYGDPDVHPQPESYWGNVNPVGPRSCYDEGKRCAETLFFDYHRQHGVEVKVARIFNTYGPGMNRDDGRVVSNFIVQALRGDPLTVYGDGRQTRSFCYVDDLIDGMIRFMNASASVQGPLNFGNPAETTMLELAETVRNLTGARSEIAFRPLPADDPKRRRPDVRRARVDLEWSPKTDLAAGLEKTIAYFDALM
ncbi:MAG: UDP-glucuronic acid decarboxylase family protein [Myxococcota bacterium]